MPADLYRQEKLDTIKRLIRGNGLCVLATASAGKPHCSLMAYAVDDDCMVLYMATPKGSRKYRNLMDNPQVSLLIDNRDQHGATATPEAKALTVSGAFQPLGDAAGLDQARSRLLARHPEMSAFVHDAHTEVFAVKVESYLLLEGIAESYFITV